MKQICSVVNLPTLCSDGWSLGVLIERLSAYTAFSTNQSSPLPQLPVTLTLPIVTGVVAEEVLESWLSYSDHSRSSVLIFPLTEPDLLPKCTEVQRTI